MPLLLRHGDCIQMITSATCLSRVATSDVKYEKIDSARAILPVSTALVHTMKKKSSAHLDCIMQGGSWWLRQPVYRPVKYTACWQMLRRDPFVAWYVRCICPDLFLMPVIIVVVAEADLSTFMHARILHANKIYEWWRGFSSCANVRHYCNLAETTRSGLLCLTLISHRLFARFLFASNTRRFALFTRKSHHSIVTLVINEITLYFGNMRHGFLCIDFLNGYDTWVEEKSAFNAYLSIVVILFKMYYNII